MAAQWEEKNFSPPHLAKYQMTENRGAGISRKWESCLLELLDGTLVDTTALVDQVTGLLIIMSARLRQMRGRKRAEAAALKS